MNSALIVVDDLHVGGIERIALDQLYCLSDFGVDSYLVVLSKENKLRSSMIEIDSEFFKQYSNKVFFSQRKWQSQLRLLFWMYRTKKISIALCHSPRANFICRIVKIMTFSRGKIVAFIHQVPTFSNKKQNLKRGLYFRFADYVWAGSNQFKLELDRLRQESLFYQLLFRSDVKFDRPGVYLRRLNHMKNAVKSLRVENRPLVFYGRAVPWKGVNTFLNLSYEGACNKPGYILTSREYSSVTKEYAVEGKGDLTIIVSKNIASIDWINLAIHIYPTDYGEDTKFPMSISLNVLECIALGIPSVVSYEGYESWPEFRHSILCIMTNWEYDDVLPKIDDLSRVPAKDLLDEARRLEEVISIEHQCIRIMSITE
jgi:hypothetical protein